MQKTKILAVVVAALLSGCSLFYDVVPFARDMGGCEPSPACTLTDMHVASDGGGSHDLGCEMVCTTPQPDLMPACTPATVATSCASASQPICDTSSEMCRGCTSSADNSQCAAHANGANVCNTSTGKCVECNVNADCTSSTKPICETTANTCRACKANSECTSGVCEFSTGACVPATMIALVDHAGMGVTACEAARTAAGAQTGNDAAHAYCDIGSTANVTVNGLADGRAYLLVAGYGGGGMAYNSITSIPRTTTIVGPGFAATNRAVVNGTAVNPAVTLGSLATLTLDGLELTAGAASNQGINCNHAGATLIVRNSYIDGNNGAGIGATSCAVTLDANIVYQNTGGGLNINGGSVTASNNLIVGNGTSGPGVLFVGSVGGTWWFNTVADNLRTGSNAAAFSCAAATAAPVVQASIVWGNTKDGSGSSVGTGCSFTYTDIDDTTTPTGTGNFNMNPMLTSGTLPVTGYRIPATSPAVNKVTAATGLTGGTLPDHDVDGKPRPRAATGGDDIGGSQAP